MGKSIVTMNKEIRKKAHEETNLGKIEKQLQKFYNDIQNQRYFENEDGEVEKMNPNIRWIDVHRATTRSKQTDIENEFADKMEALRDEYAQKTDNLLCEQMQKELDYLNNLKHGN
jgi:hypothetical protein